MYDDTNTTETLTLRTEPASTPGRNGISPWWLAFVPAALVFGLFVGGAGGYLYGHKDVDSLQAQATATRTQIKATQAKLEETESDLTSAQADVNRYRSTANSCESAANALQEALSETLNAASAATEEDYFTGLDSLDNAQLILSDAEDKISDCIGEDAGDVT